MTWLSRLLPQSRRLPRVSARKGRTPLSKRHRRMATLEHLEQRTVLSTIGVNFSAGLLTINIDRANNTLEISEVNTGNGTFVTLNASGTSRLAVGGGPATGTSWTSPLTVGNIVVNGAATTSVNVDNITLDSVGSTVAGQTVKDVHFNFAGTQTHLILDVEGVNNQGGLFVTAGGSARGGGALDVTVNDSSFNSISILQTGCCPANVTLTNDRAGTVTVSEGWADGDTIFLADNTFGATTLTQQAGTQPSAPACNGDNDSINVDGGTYLDLSVTQAAKGTGLANNNVVEIEDISVGLNGNILFGVRVVQGDGAGDSAIVESVTTVGNNQNVTVAPCAGISIFQGNGVADHAAIQDSTVPGDVTITQLGQGDPLPPTSTTPAANSGDFDEAIIFNVLAGLPRSLACGKIAISQGNGYSDMADIEGSATWMLSISISQGNGKNDEAEMGPDDGDLPPWFLDEAPVKTYANHMPAAKGRTGESNVKGQPTSFDTAAGIFSLFFFDPKVTVPGTISITQGDPTLAPDKTPDSGDVAELDNVFAAAGISITQNDATNNPNGNYAEIYGAVAASGDITISQQNRDGDYAVIDYSYAYNGNIGISQVNGSGDIAVVEYSYANGDITVSQQEGDNDLAVVASSTATGDVTITQGNGNYDTAYALGVVAGTVTYPYGYGQLPVDVAGTLTITQGDGYCDLVNVDSFNDTDTTVNNLFIQQGNDINFPGCIPGCPDTVNVNDTDVTSDMTIIQGTAAAAADPNSNQGFFVINIATGPTGPVYVGGTTSITQHGGGNEIHMGGNFQGDDAGEGENFGCDFSTTFLDIFTGENGDAFVTAENVCVFLGSALGNDFVIDGGGTGNVFEDDGGNTGVTISGNFNV